MPHSGAVKTSSTTSTDGTAIAYHSVGEGPRLVIVGGVLSDGSNYLHLAEALAGRYAVHVMERRGRSGSGPQRLGHSIEDERADLLAVAAATGSRAAFGTASAGLSYSKRPGVSPSSTRCSSMSPAYRFAASSQPTGSTTTRGCSRVATGAARSPG